MGATGLTGWVSYISGEYSMRPESLPPGLEIPARLNKNLGPRQNSAIIARLVWNCWLLQRLPIRV